MFSLQDQNILECLRKAKALHPHLEELFHLYEQLFQLQFAFKAGLRNQGKGFCPGDKEIDLTHLAEGIPQVTFDELHMEAAPVIDLYKGIETLMIRYAGHLPSGEGEPTPDMIVGYAREIFDGRGPLLVGAGRPADVIRMASGFVLAPYLQMACEFMMPRIAQSAWHRGYCPVCGGVPAFAAVRDERSSRTLLCSRCNGEWSFRRFGCPFCLERDHQTYYPSEEGRHRLYVCEACHRYLKSLDMRESACESCLPVEALATVSMDIAAREKGCTFY
jgi:hypothetical protein